MAVFKETKSGFLPCAQCQDESVPVREEVVPPTESEPMKDDDLWLRGKGGAMASFEATGSGFQPSASSHQASIVEENTLCQEKEAFFLPPSCCSIVAVQTDNDSIPDPPTPAFGSRGSPESPSLLLCLVSSFGSCTRNLPSVESSSSAGASSNSKSGEKTIAMHS